MAPGKKGDNKMKVGIISMQRVVNYGSFLQAFGLKKLIESYGHQVVFIDYKYGCPVIPTPFKTVLYQKLRQVGFLAWCADTLLPKSITSSFRKKYNRQFLPVLNVTYHRNLKEKVDIAVIGSDEVFNCLQGGGVGFSPMLFGQGIRTKKVISYAASFGSATLEGLKKYNVEDKLKEFFRSFSDISVRDENSQKIILALTGKNPVINLDPVLVYDFELPKTELPLKDYVILYTYTSRPYTSAEKQQILDFCSKNGKKLVAFYNTQDWVPNKIKANPFELLLYFKNADFIITDTFHGAVFSIKYNKNFVCRVRPDNKNKLENLLLQLQKKERQIENYMSLQWYYENAPDYSKTNSIIQQKKMNTQRYLQDNICL